MRSAHALIITYNRKDLLNQCLEAVTSQTVECRRIIVIDNASTDGTAEHLENYWRPRVEVHTLTRNLGPASAFNVGLRLAYLTGADPIWVMDDDVIPASDALERLLAAAESLDGDGIDWPYLVSVARTPRGMLCNVPGIDLSCNEIWAENWPGLLDRKLVPVVRATFVSMLLPLRTVERHGAPIPEMFIWGDDVEYTMRIARAGKPGYVVGDSKALHLRQIQGELEIEAETNPVRIGYHFYRTRNLVMLRRSEGVRIFIQEVTTNLRRILHLARRGQFAKARIVLAGTWAGLAYRPKPARGDTPFTDADPVEPTLHALRDSSPVAGAAPDRPAATDYAPVGVIARR